MSRIIGLVFLALLGGCSERGVTVLQNGDRVTFLEKDFGMAYGRSICRYENGKVEEHDGPSCPKIWALKLGSK